ncbi:MAG TPA: hypothetical protein VIF62_26940 [Labilithrix sp.]
MTRKDERPAPLLTADPLRNFSLPAEEKLRALAIGVPAWSARKRRIEDREDEIVRILVATHAAALAKGATPSEARALVTQRADAFDLGKLRQLVADHNRWYPIEANLPVDPGTGMYLARGRKWTPEPEPTVERLLARAFADLEAR